jgi:hypothetical protein
MPVLGADVGMSAWHIRDGEPAIARSVQGIKNSLSIWPRRNAAVINRQKRSKLAKSGHTKTPIMKLTTVAMTLLAYTSADSCGDKYTAQTKCDADATCTWCKNAALPSACWTKANAKSLPSGMYQCDSMGNSTQVECVREEGKRTGAEGGEGGGGLWMYAYT